MRRLAALASIAILLVSCSPQGEATGTTNKCAASLYPAYNSKNLEQCVAVCIKCDQGTPTTCTTSCTLKGAR